MGLKEGLGGEEGKGRPERRDVGWHSSGRGVPGRKDSEGGEKTKDGD